MFLLKKSINSTAISSHSKAIIKRFSTTAQNIFDDVRKDFEKENVPEIDSSLEIIMSHVLNERNLETVRKNAAKIELDDEQKQRFLELCEARKGRMPIQYIIKEWDFRNLKLKMIPPVFIPRPETEELVELILQQLNPSAEYQILDCCCGSGAIALAILNSLPKVNVIALDLSELACKLTVENARDLQLQERLRVFKHKLVEGAELPSQIHDDNQFDIIVSNPPYVKTCELRKLDPEIKIYEDLRALDGGKDGLNIIKILLKIAGSHLKPNGHLWLEVDPSQPEKIAKMIEDQKDLKLKFVASYKDLFHKDRFVEIQKLE